MRILLSVEHPAWVHQFRYVIKELEKKGHIVKIVAINKDRDLELLDAFGIPYELISNSSGKNFIEKGLIFLNTTIKIFFISRKYKPDLFLGRASPMMAINSYLFSKPHIVFEDTEHSVFSLTICKFFSDIIITPICFTKRLGKKQLRLDTYKEIFYLHPNYYQPNPETLKDLKIEKDVKNIIVVRFVAFDAHHDIGQHGILDRVGLVKALESFGRVLITSEGPIPLELEKYRTSIAPEKIHDLLYFARLYIGEGATMASECAVLGTHAVYVNTLRLGYIDEEENKYELVYTFCDPKGMEKGVLKKALELLSDQDLYVKGKQKQKKLIADKIDITAFMVWIIENYPLGVAEMKINPNIQSNFK